MVKFERKHFKFDRSVLLLSLFSQRRFVRQSSNCLILSMNFLFSLCFLSRVDSWKWTNKNHFDDLIDFLVESLIDICFESIIFIRLFRRIQKTNDERSFRERRKISQVSSKRFRTLRNQRNFKSENAEIHQSRRSGSFRHHSKRTLSKSVRRIGFLLLLSPFVLGVKFDETIREKSFMTNNSNYCLSKSTIKKTVFKQSRLIKR